MDGPIVDQVPEAPKFDSPEKAMQVLSELHAMAHKTANDVAAFTSFKETAVADLAKVSETLSEIHRKLRGPGAHAGVDFGKIHIPDDVKGNNPEVIKCYLEAQASPGSDLARFQELNDGITGPINAVKAAPGWVGDLKKSRVYREWKPLMGELQRASGDAMDTLTAGEGLEWVTPPTMSTRFIDLVRERTRLVNLLPNNFTMATHDVKFPGLSADALCYVVTEQINSTSQTKYPESLLGTRNVEFNAKDWAGRVLYSRQSIRDLTPNIAAIVNANIQRAWADGIDRGFINGDVEATHMDNGEFGWASPDMEVIWTGLRAYCVDPGTDRGSTFGSSGGGDALSVADVAAARKAMGKYGGVAATTGGGCVIMPSLNAYFDLVKDTNVHTVDKLGSSATIIPGELARLYGMSIVPTAVVPIDLNASGVGDGVTATMTACLLFDVDQFALGLYQGAEIMASDVLYMETGQIVVVITGRGDFHSFRDLFASGNTDQCVHMIYNITE